MLAGGVENSLDLKHNVGAGVLARVLRNLTGCTVTGPDLSRCRSASCEHSPRQY